MKILVASHRPAPFPDDAGYIPFQNGKLASENDLGMLNDALGVNISNRMPYYSECCALYWMAHNLDDELLGLMHYRRYFAANERITRVNGIEIAASDDFCELPVCDLVVTAERDLSPQTVEEQYQECHHAEDLKRARLVMDRLYPSYIGAYDDVLSNPMVTLYNIFVGKRSVLRHYVDWLFPILFSLEDKIPYKEYGFYQERVFSFLAERLFTVWLKANEREIKVARRRMVFVTL